MAVPKSDVCRFLTLAESLAEKPPLANCPTDKRPVVSEERIVTPFPSRPRAIRASTFADTSPLGSEILTLPPNKPGEYANSVSTLFKLVSATLTSPISASMANLILDKTLFGDCLCKAKRSPSKLSTLPLNLLLPSEKPGFCICAGISNRLISKE